MLNIGLVSPYDYASQGGVTEHIKHLSKELRVQGHRVKVLAPFSTEHADVPADVYGLGAVTHVPANGSVARISLSTDLRRTIKAILRTEHFDVIHLHEPLMPAVPWYVLRHSTTVNIGTFHAFGDYSTLYAMGRPFLKRIFAHLHGHIAVSPSAYEFVSQYFGGEYETIPNGVDVSRFGAELPPVPGMRDSRPTILFVGRFEETRKGLRWLLQALPLIEPFFPDLRVVVGGSGDPETAAEWLPLRDMSRADRRIYRSAGSAMEVEFTGFISSGDLPRYYQSCDIYCAPSTGGESFGIVLLEAMASGAPVLASRIPGYANVLTHGREGFLVEPRNPAALAAGIIRLLSDRELRGQMGEAGKRTAGLYDWPIIAGRLVSYYEQVKARATLRKRG
ncbi:MAG TPA: glycosyltransferase family 4 protein [Chloroflexia bacterium]|nr:glycosyltransferase family 4 protein [Chloroflexia bacterium]